MASTYLFSTFHHCVHSRKNAFYSPHLEKKNTQVFLLNVHDQFSNYLVVLEMGMGIGLKNLMAKKFKFKNVLPSNVPNIDLFFRRYYSNLE